MRDAQEERLVALENAVMDLAETTREFMNIVSGRLGNMSPTPSSREAQRRLRAWTERTLEQR